MKKIVLLFAMAVFAFSCNKDDGDNGPKNATVSFNFTQNWDGQAVSKADFNNTVYTNSASNFVTISKLRYLISRIVLHKADGTNVEFGEYNLVDLSDETTLKLTPSIKAPIGSYTGMSFIYGFNEGDNTSGAYLDLNAASWNWPSGLGGGYHFMQMEGMYDDPNGAPQPYAYHNGTAKKSDTEFEQNFIEVNFNQAFNINNDASIDIKMNIAEWYKNPYTWDLNVYNINLMGNYAAQILMHQNGANVFSMGAVSQ